MKALLQSFLHSLRRGGEAGQALYILAVGFIALIGFVGIVTDVSLLFIRYSTLRRAVDAAAIAAAGQMRRVEDPTGTPVGVASGDAISVANLNIAARQFIEVYGLSPTNVIVETCRTQNVPLATFTIGSPSRTVFAPLDRSGVPLFIHDATTGQNLGLNIPIADGGATIPPGTTVTVPAVPGRNANRDDVRSYNQLCTADELKLVRVTAQIEAPTVFMRLLGYDTVTLTETAISQTAVIDVVLIMDVSESMLNATSYDDWDTVRGPGGKPMGVRYIPPYVNPGFSGNPTLGIDNPWHEIGRRTQEALNTRIAPGSGPDALFSVSSTFAPNPDINDENNILIYEPNPSGTGYITFNAGTSTREEPPPLCRVRGSLRTAYGGNSPPLELRNEYNDYLNAIGLSYGVRFGDPAATPAAGRSYRGFVPMYNSFVCCNDPNLDFDFSDNICQPFREARDAAVGFLGRLDFLRGDRVSLVTFDRFARVVDPDGGGTQSFFIETERDVTDATGTRILRGAVETLEQTIGVLTDGTVYADVNPLGGDGNWDRYADGATLLTYEDLMRNLAVGQINTSPTRGACPLDNAVLDRQYNYFFDQNYPDPPIIDPTTGTEIRRLLDAVITVPGWATSFMNVGTGSTPLRALSSYEHRASCAGTNIGGALATGSATLFTGGRREGSVWIMVLLSDGAAGASNPVTRNGRLPVTPDVFATSGGRYRPVPAPAADAYGAYGLCPYGTDPATGGTAGELLLDGSFPYCGDLRPETRTFCGTVAQMPDGTILDNFPNCYEFYDVDDYARDWADWIGLAELPGAFTGPGAGRVGAQRLPTIFSIGFGLAFDTGDLGGNDCSGLTGSALDDCRRGVDTLSAANPAKRRWQRLQDYIGEELLRYIGDVGDNFQIDDDYWQAQMGSRIGNPPPNWGQRGPCQTPWTGALDDPARGTAYAPLSPETSCGNYFSASDGAALEAVFNQIASRLFTRLSR